MKDAFAHFGLACAAVLGAVAGYAGMMLFLQWVFLR